MMSSKAYGSEDRVNFELDYTPGNKGFLASIPGITPDKLSKENLEQLLGNCTPVITVSSSSTSERRSSKFINPFNDTNSSEPRCSRVIHNDELQSSKSSQLQSLLPPICFNDNKLNIQEKEGLEFPIINHKQNAAFCHTTNCFLETFKGLPNESENFLVSSPIIQSQDVVIDKDLLTSEIENYNDHLYPWIPKQESEGYGTLVESTLVHPELPNKKGINEHVSTDSDISIEIEDITAPICNCTLPSNHEEYNTVPRNKKITKRKCKENKSDTLLFTILIRPKNATKDKTRFSESEKDEQRNSMKTVQSKGKEVERTLNDDDGDDDNDDDDDEYVPKYKMTRSRSRKNRISFATYSEVQDKKKKLGPRSKSGCWTCRVRHKACPEERPTCSQCSRLKLECDYSSVRPDYMVDPLLQANKLKEIRSITFKQKRNNFTKGSIRKNCN